MWSTHIHKLLRVRYERREKKEKEKEEEKFEHHFISSIWHWLNFFSVNVAYQAVRVHVRVRLESRLVMCWWNGADNAFACIFLSRIHPIRLTINKTYFFFIFCVSAKRVSRFMHGTQTQHRNVFAIHIYLERSPIHTLIYAHYPHAPSSLSSPSFSSCFLTLSVTHSYACWNDHSLAFPIHAVILVYTISTLFYLTVFDKHIQNSERWNMYVNEWNPVCLHC